jgi:opacity protein-like surface antigen
MFDRHKRLWAAIPFLVISSGGAVAQNCVGTATGPLAAAIPNLATGSSSAAASISSAIGTANTAFLGQQGSAFVSAPGDPQPNQAGGGVWVRSVAGELTEKFSSSSNIAVSGPLASTASINCSGSVHETYSGLQVGQDIARLNWSGWNVHLGTTAGYLASQSFDNLGNQNRTDFEVPFLGTYLLATHGGFFADLMIREEFYNISTSNTSAGLFNQRNTARGTSVSTSEGYNWTVTNNWFIEPSVGFVWSQTNVDSLTAVPGFPAFIGPNEITSELGRLSLRAGTVITSGNITWQPFGTVSVFHEFAGNIITPLPSASINPALTNGQSSTSRVGTYGQYSLGLSGQIINTGWLGFVRVDYRNGENIEGWAGNVGVRYQFSPEMIAKAMPTKAPAKAYGTVINASNWTGLYVGGFFGGADGKTDVRIVGDPNNTGANPRVLGALGGGELGYNYQIKNWVLGVEGDAGATNLHGSKGCGTNLGNVTQPLNPIDFSCQDSSSWMATLAARVGWSQDRTLYYIKAGGAWADDTSRAQCNLGPLGVPPLAFLFGDCRNNSNVVVSNGFSAGGIRAGWVLGFGSEFDLGHNWSAKAEYDYIDFGTRTGLSTDGVSTLRDGGNISQVKIGLNYRFNDPGAIVARH